MSARAGHLVVAGLAGLVVMVVEFSAVRMLAPAFGQSITVWSTVIGVILVALALGYWQGGRLGERSRDERPLLRLYVWCAVFLWLVSRIGPDLCQHLVPEGLPTDRRLPLGLTGSLVATLVLYSFPAFVLATTSPFLIRLDARAGREGRATGGLYAVGTVGSLLGCYLAPLVLLQTVGTRATLELAAVALLGVALAGLGLLRRRGRAERPVRRRALPAEQAAAPIARGHLWIAGWTGLAVTVVEFAAVRYMGPYFGQSNAIWANVIGVLLLALAAGSALGGRWADAALGRGPAGGRVLHGLLVAAALLLGAVAWLGTSLCDALVPAGVDSMHVLPLAFRGSLVATLTCFAPPLLLLGMAPPFLVRMATVGEHAGRTAGVLFAFTTVGGLVGCFVTAPLLVPLLGARGALLLSALGLALLGASGLRGAQAPGLRRWPRRVALAALPAMAALLGVQVVARPPLRAQAGQVAEIESAYQTIRVVRQPMGLLVPFPADDRLPALLGDGGEAETVFLRHDEDAETYQSAVFVDPDLSRRWLTGGRYFEHMALGAFFARPAREEPLRVLVVGHAGGSVYRTLRDALPAGTPLDVLGVEIDGAVVKVARRYLRHGELEGPGLTVVTGEDARTVVNALPRERRFDLVLVDAYARTNYVPFQLATVEFFERVRAHLAPGGWVGVNVLGHGLRGPVSRAVASTLARVMGTTWVAPNPSFLGNVILWSSPGARQGPRLARDRALHPGLEAAAFSLERLAVRHDPVRDGGIVLTDDLSPSDRLADEEFGL